MLEITTIDPQRHAVEGLCSIKEACEFLSVGKSSIYNLMNMGKIPFVFVGSNRRIPRAALVQFTEQVLEQKQVSLSS
ncbi:MAG: helix-turn-helix domain-containing protein [Limnochordia bacterium]